mmetsp:Transcript_102584/g.328684  ORF Transcript_102584/g.328684 Transcript_102584/m.328684 type:complete len:305 (-) Transcript_102584:1631-2545(-)
MHSVRTPPCSCARCRLPALRPSLSSSPGRRTTAPWSVRGRAPPADPPAPDPNRGPSGRASRRCAPRRQKPTHLARDEVSCCGPRRLTPTSLPALRSTRGTTRTPSQSANPPPSQGRNPLQSADMPANARRPGVGHKPRRAAHHHPPGWHSRWHTSLAPSCRLPFQGVRGWHPAPSAVADLPDRASCRWPSARALRPRRLRPCRRCCRRPHFYSLWSDHRPRHRGFAAASEPRLRSLPQRVPRAEDLRRHRRLAQPRLFRGPPRTPQPTNPSFGGARRCRSCPRQLRRGVHCAARHALTLPSSTS